MYGTPQRTRDGLDRMPEADRVGFALDDAGPGDQNDGTAAADGQRADLDGVHGCDHTRWSARAGSAGLVSPALKSPALRAGEYRRD